MSRQRVALTTYIDSQGTELPKDWERYMVGSEREWFCLFCDENLGNGNPVYRWDEEADAHDTGCGCCNECNTHIEVMTKNVYGVMTPKNMFRDDDTANIKILRYNAEGILGPDASKYYRHYAFLRDKEGNRETKAEACYFCDDIVPENQGWITIEDARTLSGHITGGRVKCCRECESMLDVEKKRPGFDVMCSECQEFYFIDDTEHENRERLRLQNKFLCPKCANKVIFEAYRTHTTSVLGEFRYIPDNHTTTTPDRFAERLCPVCMDYFEVDLTLCTNSILQHYKRYTDYFVCAKCNERLKDVDTIDSKNKLFIAHFSRTIFIVLTKAVKGWEYSIRQLRNEGSDLLYRSTFEIDNIVDCINIAMVETQDLIYGKQGILFGNRD